MSSSKGHAADGSGFTWDRIDLRRKKSIKDLLKKKKKEWPSNFMHLDEKHLPRDAAASDDCIPATSLNATPLLGPVDPLEKRKLAKKHFPAGGNAGPDAASDTGPPPVSTPSLKLYSAAIMKAYIARDTRADTRSAAQLLTMRRALIIIMTAIELVNDEDIASNLLELPPVVPDEQKKLFRRTIRSMVDVLRTLITGSKDLTKDYDDAADALNKKRFKEIRSADREEFLEVMLLYVASES